MRNNFFLRALSTLAILLLFTGCANHAKIVKENDKAVAEAQAKIQESLKTASRSDFEVINDRYVDTHYFDIPATWKTKTVTLNVNRQPLEEVLNDMTEGLGLEIIIPPEVRAYPVSLSYQGNLYGALKALASDNNLAFTLEKENSQHPIFRWSPIETRTFQIAWLPGNTSFNVGAGSSSGGGGTTATSSVGSSTTSSDSVSNINASDSDNWATLSGSVSLWKDLLDSVQKLLSPRGKFSESQSTSTITVTDTPFNVAQVAKFVEEYNKVLSSRVSIQVTVLEVTLQNDHAAGIDWTAVYQYSKLKLGLTGKYATNLTKSFLDTGTASAFQTNILHGPFKNTNIIVQALDQQGKASVIISPTIVSLNNQPSKISIGKNEGYIKNTTVNITTGTQNTTSTAFTPGNINTGINLTIIPHIQDNKIYISLNVKLTALESLTEKTSKDEQSIIQLPNTTDRVFNQRIMADDESLIVLSGLREEQTAVITAQNFGSNLLGGNSGLTYTKELVVLINPKIIERG